MARIKICGITTPEQALMAAQAGADAIGLVFYEPSPRNLSIELAQAICDALPPFVTTVGLFVNPEKQWLKDIIAAVPFDLIQFHGDEGEPFCAQFNKPYVKAIRMRSNVDLIAQCQTFYSSRGILLDTFVAGQPGGTGQTFDWSKIPKSLPKPIILAGGLTPENVGSAVAQVKPWAVDVSGGVESAKGVKDRELINAFIRGVHGVSEHV